ncbi:hypothetical protein [Rhodococcus qingshengii]|uniref:hypothetical protein n=1 Tax=Rhodococcus qingshengii TaxID=334542 RepID=UPI0029433074|nr:hypothetical protein [Rhodococcus qingshengii]WOI85972.1 hypothetical protein R0122_22600 [Rhodococcus qingshengii]
MSDTRKRRVNRIANARAASYAPNNELFELCKFVYEATGWLRYKTEVDADFYFATNDIEKKIENYEVVSREHYHFPQGFISQDFIPLYDSDYLLEKLPPVIQDDYDRKFRHIQMWINGNGECHACYVEPYDAEFRGAYAVKSDAMRKALLKLTKTLIEAGEIKNLL